MTVLHIGGFDSENYGDLLFPLILERRLGRVPVIHATPTGTNPPWSDSVSTTSIAAILSGPPSAQAVVLGGGSLVTHLDSPLPLYGDARVMGAYPMMWLAAARCAAEWGVPSCWNSPGAPRFFEDHWRDRLRMAAASIDYLAVRDRHSHDVLRGAGVTGEIETIPDTAFDVSTLWNDADLDAAYRRTVGPNAPGRTFAVHVTKRRTHEPPEGIGQRIGRIARALEATPLLLALGPCHGDAELQRQVAAELDCPSVPVDRPDSIRQLAACIARSVLYVGSSLHGLITAIAFGVPGLVVAPERSSGLRKYSGLLAHCDHPGALVEDWAQLEETVLGSAADLSDLRPRSLRHVRGQLDAHWAKIRAVLRLD